MYTVHGIDNIDTLCTMDCVVFPSLQLPLPEGTQPRWGHTVTSFRLDEETVHTTTFGGCPEYDPKRSEDDDLKLADTTVMEFGEWYSAVYTMFLAEIRKEGGLGEVGAQNTF